MSTSGLRITYSGYVRALSALCYDPSKIHTMGFKDIVEITLYSGAFFG